MSLRLPFHIVPLSTRSNAIRAAASEYGDSEGYPLLGKTGRTETPPPFVAFAAPFFLRPFILRAMDRCTRELRPLSSQSFRCQHGVLPTSTSPLFLRNSTSAPYITVNVNSVMIPLFRLKRRRGIFGLADTLHSNGPFQGIPR